MAQITQAQLIRMYGRLAQLAHTVERMAGEGFKFIERAAPTEDDEALDELLHRVQWEAEAARVQALNELLEVGDGIEVDPYNSELDWLNHAD